jgi:membrane-associated phospholipid phosphatase
METAHASATVGFYGAVPAAWAGAALRGGPYADAYRLTLAQGTAFVAMAGLKRLIRRPRPYAAVPGLVSRSDAYDAGRDAPSFAMPSGHATLTAVLATSWSLSHPRWYVVAPGAAWAASVSLSRVWRGVHYPTDVLAGTLLGAGVGVLVHVVGPYLTPGVLEGDDAPPMMGVTLRF